MDYIYSLTRKINTLWGTKEQPTTMDFSHGKLDFFTVMLKLSEEDAAVITIVNLSDCDLTVAPRELGQLRNLEELNLSWNKITNLGDISAILPASVCVLDCSGNPMMNLPASIGGLTDLEVLTVCKANLQSIPAELSSLVKLRELNLFTNKLTTVPATFLQGNASLTELNLAHNELESLPLTSFRDTVLLRRLALHTNKLRSLPPLTNLTKLEKLELQRNRLTVFPEMSQHHNLVEIDLSGNGLTELPAALFERENLPELVRLQLTSNKLKSLPTNLASLPKLAQLGLASNQLSELPLPIYRMQSLAHIDLSRNQFTDFPPDLSFLQYNLQTFYVSRNKLTSIPPTLTLFGKLRAFSVTGNPLDLKDTATAETYATLRLNVADRKRGKFLGINPADEITEAEYWRNAWGMYEQEGWE